MFRDTFDAGVEPGGLHSHREINLLICYMLSSIDQPLSREGIVTVLCGNGMANFFDICTAIDDLLSLHNLEQDEQGQLTVTDTGRHAAMTLRDMLPFTLRERSVSSAKQLLNRLKNEKENEVSISKNNNGFTVNCTVGNADTPLMSLSLSVGNENQAQMIADRFLNDPLSLYKAVIDTLTTEGDVV